MLRLAALPLLFVLHAASVSPAAPPAEPRPEGPAAEAPLKLDFRIASAKPEATLISGQLQARPFSLANFEQRAAKGLDEVKMSVMLKPQRDDAVAVELQWEEGSADGHLMRWSMTLLGKRGTPLVGTIAWPGDSRTVTVTVR